MYQATDEPTTEGAFSLSRLNGANSDIYGGSGRDGFYWLNLDASLANKIYGLTDTVQPPALQLIAQIKF